MIWKFFFLICLLSFLTKSITAQQNYSQESSLNCNISDFTTAPSSASFYTCNGQNHSCQAFLIFQSKPSYDSVPNISALFSADPEEVSMINNVTKFQSFPPKKEVIVPVICSCFGQSYQADTTFHVTKAEGTYYYISSTTFQGLSSCSGMMKVNPYDANLLPVGLELQVPLRCACPTANQSTSGTKFLMTYSLDPDDNVPDIAHRFGVSAKSVLDANGLEENPTLYTGTTILIPLPDPPTSSQTIIRSDPPENSPSLGTINTEERKSEKKMFEYVGLAAACTLLVLIIIGTSFVLLSRKRRGNVSGKGYGKKQELPEDVRLEIANVDQVLKVYGIEELKEATNDFSSKHRIKGCVYYGKLDGETLAVKKMSRDVSMEVNILMKIQHFNLIKPRGVCQDGGCFYLVFGYMKNGSLREWLSSERVKKNVDGLTQRIQIALDIANGLYYLHSFTEPAYIHKDITSNNILLDNELRGKIANFRLARASAREESTKNVVGTRGYMAPEYVESGKATPKIDVYAFGVVLLELITGKDAVFKQDEKEALLSAEGVSVMEKENAEDELGFFLDPNLSTSQEKEFAVRLAKLSIACLSTEAEKRPNMEDVVCGLLKIEADLHKSESSSVQTSNEVSPLWMSSIIKTKRMADIAK